MTDITQADRDAAAATPCVVGFRAIIRAGKLDDNSVVQAFAAHRIATQTAIADMLDEMAGKEQDFRRTVHMLEIAAKVRGMA